MDSSNMKMSTWESMNIFEIPLKPGQIHFKTLKLNYPQGVDVIIRENWNKQLNDKKMQLIKIGLQTHIDPYISDGIQTDLNALYEGDRPIMWPGPVVILKDIAMEKDQVVLNVCQSAFPFINGLRDERIVKLYIDQKIAKPRPPLAICTFALTTDGFLVLTIRGEKTNMYPGRFYGQGGNPLFVNTDIVEHQVDEMYDEILVNKSEFDSKDFRFLGVVIDKDELQSKPDLVGYIPVNLTSEEISMRVKQRSLNERPNDAFDVSFAPADNKGLLAFLKKTEIKSFCPPAHGGLVLFGYHRFGKEWINTLLKKPNNILQS